LKNALGSIIKNIFKSDKKDSKEGASKKFEEAKRTVENLSRDVAQASSRRDQEQWKLDNAKSELSIAKIQLSAAKDSVLYVGSYVKVANEAADSYKRAVNVSEAVTRGIDGAAKEVAGIEIQQFTSENSIKVSTGWMVLGFFAGIIFTLFATRDRRRRKVNPKVLNELLHSEEKFVPTLKNLELDTPTKRVKKNVPKKTTKKAALKKKSKK
jgi:hypothetical protein